MNDVDRRVSAGLFLLFFVTYAWFFGGGGWNQNANFDLTRAIVERRTFAIDAYRDNTYDISFHDGHVYANKAPGVSLLAVPVYALLLTGEQLAGVDPSSFAATTLNLYVVGAVVCGGSGALLIAMLYRYGRRRGFAIGDVLMVAFSIGLGTYLFAYSTVFFAHVPAALFLFWSFARFSEDADRNALAGAALGGLSVVCNYISAMPLAVIVAAAMLQRGDRLRRLTHVVLGGAPFALFLMFFHTVCFGSPFRTAVEATSGIFQTPGALLGVFGLPRLDALVAILFSRYRGLFFLSPILAFGLAGLVVSWRRRQLVRECAVCAIAVLTLVVTNAAFNNWHGGSAVGPRYILPAVAFLAVPMFLAISIMKTLRNVLLVISMLGNFGAAAVNPMPSRTIADPIWGYTLPLLFTGRLPADTPAHPPLAWKRMTGYVSVNRHAADELLPFMKHPPGSVEGDWASFNVGELAFAGSPLSLGPVIVWIGLGAWLLARKRESASPREVTHAESAD